jgi:hypothetical protein
MKSDEKEKITQQHKAQIIVAETKSGQQEV